MKRLFRLLVLAAVLASVFRASISLAGAVTSTASGGNWSANSTWVGNKVPGTGDDVTIVAGASVTVTAGDFCHSITFGNNSASTATLTVNAGVTLAVGNGITAQNAASTNTSVLIQGAGTLTCGPLTVGGTTTPTMAGSDFTATLTSTISTLTIAGNLSINALYNSAQAAANQGTFALSSGSVTASSVNFGTVPFFGPILTMATGAQSGTLSLSGGGPFNYGGSGSSTFTANGTNATVIYSGAGQTVAAVVYQNLSLTNNGNKTVSGVTVNGTLSVQGQAQATAVPTYGPNAVLQYDGNGPQTSGPELTAGIPSLMIINSNGVTLANSTTVSNVLALVSGQFITGANRLIVGTNGSISGGSSNSYVNGNLQKNFGVGTNSFLFPVGDTEFAPLNVSNLSVTVAGAVTTSTKSGAPPQMAASGINATHDVNRYWILTNSSGTFGPYAATFNYPAADLSPGALPAQFGAAVFNAGAWTMADVNGIPTTNSTSISGQSGFGTFVVGDVTNPPVGLAITSINSGSPPQVGSSFTVTVQSQAGNGTPRNVTGDTGIAISLNAGSGVLGGTVTGTIPAGNNSVTIAGVTYSAAQSGVQLAAAVTSGETLSNAISAAFTVNPGNQTINFPSPGNQTYGVGPIALSATASSGLAVSFGVTSGFATVSNGNLVITGVGPVTVQALQAGSANWNAATPVSQTISVATKTITAGFTANNKTYDGTTTATLAGTSLSGVINSDIVNLTVGSAAFGDKNVGNGKTVVASGLGLSGANAGNYVIASNSATNTANISAATLTVTANNTNRAYGLANPVFTVSYSGFVNGEGSGVLNGNPTVTSTATPTSPVPGSPYLITANQGTLSATNYTFNFVNGNLTVTPATLTVTANNTNRVYGSANPIFTVTYSGFVNSEGTGVLSGAPTVTSAATPTSPVPGSPYTITVSQGTLSATNYSFNFVNGNLTVTPATLTVTANDTNRVYGSPNPVFAFNYSGFVNGESTGVLNGAPTVASTATPTSPVPGSPYSITASQGTLSATNYSFSFVNGNLTVTPAALTVTANNQSRPYGTTNPVLTASYSGFVNGESTNILNGSPSLSTAADSSSPPGMYPIQVAAGTLTATNYTLSFGNGTLTVQSVPPVLTIQLSADAANSVIVSAVGLTPNGTYQVLGSTDLVNWAEIGSAQSAGDGSLLFTNPVASSVQFYRTLGP